MDIPSWYKPQPRSPWCVYDESTIRDIQRTLQCAETGELDETTVNRIKGLQHVFGIRGTGVIDAETAEQIERLRTRWL